MIVGYQGAKTKRQKEKRRVENLCPKCGSSYVKSLTEDGREFFCGDCEKYFSR